MSSKNKKIIGWVIIIFSSVIALVISARTAIFGGQPLGETNFYWMIIQCIIVLGGYAIATSVGKK
ncbi:MAG: hypothetical protein FWG91_02035 [Lachnospiraceae bacterium]|nr:hypothetical protein [Lachnospiraceae bacterium]